MIAPYQMLDSVTGGRNRPRNRVTGYGAAARNRGGVYIPEVYTPTVTPAHATRNHGYAARWFQ